MNIEFTILGEPASKANSREIVARKMRDAWGGMKTRPMSIKSEKARDYERSAKRQIPKSARVALTGPVRVTMRIFYASERPDLDESVILDVLQSKFHNVTRSGKEVRECTYRGVYINDRQVRQKFIMHGIDRSNPRAEIRVEPLQAQQAMLDFDAVPYDAFETPPEGDNRRGLSASRTDSPVTDCAGELRGAGEPGKGDSETPPLTATGAT
ncbi:hypothetical protein VSR82_25255 [Burkholderia sp. JPY481]